MSQSHLVGVLGNMILKHEVSIYIPLCYLRIVFAHMRKWGIAYSIFSVQLKCQLVNFVSLFSRWCIIRFRSFVFVFFSHELLMGFPTYQIVPELYIASRSWSSSIHLFYIHPHSRSIMGGSLSPKSLITFYSCACLIFTCHIFVMCLFLDQICSAYLK